MRSQDLKLWPLSQSYPLNWQAGTDMFACMLLTVKKRFRLLICWNSGVMGKWLHREIIFAWHENHRLNNFAFSLGLEEIKMQIVWSPAALISYQKLDQFGGCFFEKMNDLCLVLFPSLNISLLPKCSTFLWPQGRSAKCLQKGPPLKLN